jgi:hypothetical protein
MRRRLSRLSSAFVELFLFATFGTLIFLQLEITQFPHLHQTPKTVKFLILKQRLWMGLEFGGHELGSGPLEQFLQSSHGSPHFFYRI